MKRLTISDAETVILAIHGEMRRSPEARYAHRLHGLLLVAQGMSALEVARLLGDGARTVARWVRQFERDGLRALVEGERSGRPHRLSDAQRAVIDAAHRKSPAEVGLSGSRWDGKMLSVFIERSWSISLGVRQCQRLFRQLGFRSRTPRPLLAKADPEAKSAYIKTRRTGPGPSI